MNLITKFSKITINESFELFSSLNFDFSLLFFFSKSFSSQILNPLKNGKETFWTQSLEDYLNSY